MLFSVRKLPAGGSRHHEEGATEATREGAEHSRQHLCIYFSTVATLQSNISLFSNFLTFSSVLSVVHMVVRLVRCTAQAFSSKENRVVTIANNFQLPFHQKLNARASNPNKSNGKSPQSGFTSSKSGTSINKYFNILARYHPVLEHQIQNCVEEILRVNEEVEVAHRRQREHMHAHFKNIAKMPATAKDDKFSSFSTMAMRWWRVQTESRGLRERRNKLLEEIFTLGTLDTHMNNFMKTTLAQRVPKAVGAKMTLDYSRHQNIHKQTKMTWQEQGKIMYELAQLHPSYEHQGTSREQESSRQQDTGREQGAKEQQSVGDQQLSTNAQRGGSRQLEASAKRRERRRRQREG